jgi:hypothetical protein
VAPDRCPTEWDTTVAPGGVYARGPLDD